MPANQAPEKRKSAACQESIEEAGKAAASWDVVMAGSLMTLASSIIKVNAF